MNAANTSSAFDGQRRYTVALLAWAAAATASSGQAVVAVFLQQLQRHREQLGFPRRPRRRLRAALDSLGHSV